MIDNFILFFFFLPIETFVDVYLRVTHAKLFVGLYNKSFNSSYCSMTYISCDSRPIGQTEASLVSDIDYPRVPFMWNLSLEKMNLTVLDLRSK